MTILSDIKIGDKFYMTFGGMDFVPFTRISETYITYKAISSNRLITIEGKSEWEVITEQQYQEAIDFACGVHGYMPVPGHSSQWPYGEH